MPVPPKCDSAAAQSHRWRGLALRRPRHAGTIVALVLLVASCGGGGGGAGGGPDDAPAEPTATIVAPAAGSTFRAGERVSFVGTATDARDGPLAESALTWWVELHHDDHTHPFRQPTPGGSGEVTIPTRGETSDNIFYRFHLRATNRAGNSVEVTRDLTPRKAPVTLATAPPGLRLTLDGQSITAPHGFAGVVGLERDIGAADQVALGRRWRFAAWSQGGAASQTISTPEIATTYTANFTDDGPATNEPPTVALAAVADLIAGVPMILTAIANDADGSVVRVDFFEGTALIGSDTSAPFSLTWTPAAAGTTTLRARALDNGGLGTDSAALSVTVRPMGSSDATPPSATLTAPAPLADGLVGVLTLSAEAADNIGVVGVEFQVDGWRVGSELVAPPFTMSIDTTGWASGQHVIRVRARDAAGNRSPWSEALVRFGGEREMPAGITRDEAWVTGLSSATAMALAPDGRVFVAEQSGTLRVVKNGTLLAAPFHRLVVDDSGERGLIGVALHPAFASNGFVYVHHTRIDGDQSNNRVTRLVASPGDADRSTGVETPLVDLPALSFASNHNGGALKFGSDGKLYVAVGDNANSAWPQDLSSPLGKMLRFNDDGTIPSDNPFFGSQSGLARAIWAYGLRNPFTFAIEPGSGRMHINDVGQVTWEEINLGSPGANYGWPVSEGPDALGAGITAPLYAYKHSVASPEGAGPGGFFVGSAIAGGVFYPGRGPFPQGLHGKYFFADYVDRFIAVLDTANANAVYSFGRVGGLPVDLAAGADGALLVLTRDGITRFTAP